jgi:hypothetical protein
MLHRVTSSSVQVGGMKVNKYASFKAIILSMDFENI